MTKPPEGVKRSVFVALVILCLVALAFTILTPEYSMDSGAVYQRF
jgi:hypothetical protein